jgi:pimeloyl-ACP methyl ester carboxylesterase
MAAMTLAQGAEGGQAGVGAKRHSGSGSGLFRSNQATDRDGLTKPAGLPRLPAGKLVQGDGPMQNLVMDVNGVQLHVTEEGSGAPLLFLHGAGGANWSPMLQRLSAHFRVIAPEHPGFGRGPLPDWMMSMGDLAFFYQDLLKKLALPRLHLVGHSLGGWLASEIAIRSTAGLASLTLMSPAGCAVEEAPFGDIFLWTPEQAARKQFYNQDLAEARIKALANADLDVALQNKAAAARLAWSPRLCSIQLPNWLHRIDVPTQLIWGENDEIVPAACRRVFLREIPGARLTLLPETGHSLHSERPAEVAEQILRFCQEHAA